jgi:hypothetical protein
MCVLQFNHPTPYFDALCEQNKFLSVNLKGRRHPTSFGQTKFLNVWTRHFPKLCWGIRDQFTGDP